MGRTFITGDVHGSIETKRLSFKNWPQSRELTKEDAVIICGDAGFNWDNSSETNYWTDWLENRPFTTLSVLGNHENYDAISALPVEKTQYGFVRKVRPHVMYLLNGESYWINNKAFFVQGGAASTDKALRKEGKSWWAAEIPSYSDFNHAAETLELMQFKTDYVLSHTAPNSIINQIDRFSPRYDDVTNFLEKFVLHNVEYKDWFAGHFHIDRTIPEKRFHFLYNDIIELLPNGDIEVVNEV